MQLRTLMFTIFFGLLSATVITGCSDKEESKQDNKEEKKQDNGHGHSHSYD